MHNFLGKNGENYKNRQSGRAVSTPIFENETQV